MVIPIFLALYVSFTNWSGLTSPFSHSVQLVGLTNYRTLVTRPGLYQTDFATSIRDNFYFFLFTVPLQTVLALWLANLVNSKFLRAKGFFRPPFFPVRHELDRYNYRFYISLPGRRRRQHHPWVVRGQATGSTTRTVCSQIS